MANIDFKEYAGFRITINDIMSSTAVFLDNAHNAPIVARIETIKKEVKALEKEMDAAIKSLQQWEPKRND